MSKEQLINDLSILFKVPNYNVKLIIDQYERFILKIITENPDKVIHVTNLGKFVVKEGRKKHWRKLEKLTGLTKEERELMSKKIKT